MNNRKIISILLLLVVVFISLIIGEMTFLKTIHSAKNLSYTLANANVNANANANVDANAVEGLTTGCNLSDSQITLSLNSIYTLSQNPKITTSNIQDMSTGLTNILSSPNCTISPDQKTIAFKILSQITINPNLNPATVSSLITDLNRLVNPATK